jgi:hypothetical protein
MHALHSLARDRGCTKPGCTAPGYWCEAHHVDGWTADNSPTDIDKLTLACPPHNRLIEKTGWRTRKRKDGRTEWLPPPNLDTGQPGSTTTTTPSATSSPTKTTSLLVMRTKAKVVTATRPSRLRSRARLVVRVG